MNIVQRIIYYICEERESLIHRQDFSF